MALALGGLAIAAGSATAGYAYGSASHGPHACPLDGGGTIASGDAARTDTGVWGCADGQLYRLG